MKMERVRYASHLVSVITMVVLLLVITCFNVAEGFLVSKYYLYQTTFTSHRQINSKDLDLQQPQSNVRNTL